MLYPALFSLWIALWAVVCATLPAHFVLHGLLMRRIARAEGWRSITRRGRYIRALREDRSLFRAMALWLLINLAEILLLIGLTAILFASS